MTTLGQTLANRENAQKSTGPKTEEGKAAAARNSLKHGLTALEVVVKQEDAAAFASFGEVYLNELDPQTVAQLELAERIVAMVWKVRRVESVETVLWNSGGGSLEDMAVMLGTHSRELDLLLRYGRQNERKLAAAREEYRRMQAEHRRQQEELARRQAAAEKAAALRKQHKEEDAWAESMAHLCADGSDSQARVAAKRAGKSEEEATKAGQLAWQEGYAASIVRSRKMLGRNTGELMNAGWYVQEAEKEKAAEAAEKEKMENRG